MTMKSIVISIDLDKSLEIKLAADLTDIELDRAISVLTSQKTNRVWATSKRHKFKDELLDVVKKVEGPITIHTVMDKFRELNIPFNKRSISPNLTILAKKGILRAVNPPRHHIATIFEMMP